ncbi:PREDICTED: MTSS1-like protein, partial [Gekko japonicus]|uniref:MTSS1-like protein n=1 Tax=Gekko japonicus TaxID=146911 RepID=A0ABM1KDZ1_GEKJA
MESLPTLQAISGQYGLESTVAESVARGPASLAICRRALWASQACAAPSQPVGSFTRFVSSVLGHPPTTPHRHSLAHGSGRLSAKERGPPVWHRGESRRRSTVMRQPRGGSESGFIQLAFEGARRWGDAGTSSGAPGLAEEPPEGSLPCPPSGSDSPNPQLGKEFQSNMFVDVDTHQRKEDFAALETIWMRNCVPYQNKIHTDIYPDTVAIQTTGSDFSICFSFVYGVDADQNGDSCRKAKFMYPAVYSGAKNLAWLKLHKGFSSFQTGLQQWSLYGTAFDKALKVLVFDQSSYPIWEDFNSKATKLHSQLRTTVLAAVAFLDAFQKVADMATNTRGATRDIGSALTRMCMRHRSIEAKLRQFTNALMESLINPLQDRIEDWKKTANQLDKDHAKDYKRARHEIKKKSSDTLKLQKKARKELLGKGDLQPQLDNALQDVSDMYLLLEETEKQAVRKALVEERGRFCTFIAYLQPVVNGEITMLGEITHLQGIIDDLVVLTAEPHKLPPASEQVIKDLKGSDYSWSYQTPPSSPSSSGSRKSSMCSLAQPVNANTRLSSVSSHDSGFISQDAMFSKPPSPMPSDITSQKSSSSASSEASETCQSVSECNSPTSWKPLNVALGARTEGSSRRSLSLDWSKATLYEQPVANTLQRRKDRVEHLREAEMGSATLVYPGVSLEEGSRPRMSPASIAAK